VDAALTISADFDGSGALSYLRSDLFDRPAIQAPIVHWPMRLTANTLSLPAIITFTSIPSMHYLTLPEQRIFDAALRRSIKIVSEGKPRV
jgi:hypothetical protein